MSDRRPNVLLVTLDQWPARLLGIEGRSDILTPTLDQVARNGVRFSNAYSECPVCIPARRTLMTGTSARRHGDRVFQPALPMPSDLPTLATCFREAGYQAAAVGKLHVYPPRDRIGFDDVLLAEEGRAQLGAIDDYDIFLAEQGHAGEQFMHGMSNNEYHFRPWHLAERLHVTNWITREMTRIIQRRDPLRPAFWYLSYTHPHPPLVPLRDYLEIYRDIALEAPVDSLWSANVREMPVAISQTRAFYADLFREQSQATRRAFHALCTHIDHQLRIVIGTLREAGLLDDTIILVTSDHGEMLGDHGLWGKRLLLDGAAKVPLLFMDRRGETRVQAGVSDNRLVSLADIMPTLLDAAGLPVPPQVEGISLLSPDRRDHLYGECREDAGANRMVRDARYKLVWYPCGNAFQLFDLIEDPLEQDNIADDPAKGDVVSRMKELLRERLYGADLAWIERDRFVGFASPATQHQVNRGLSGQRGHHYPPPPRSDPSEVVGSA